MFSVFMSSYDSLKVMLSMCKITSVLKQLQDKQPVYSEQKSNLNKYFTAYLLNIEF